MIMLFKMLGVLMLIFFIVIILFVLGIFNRLRGKGGGFGTGGSGSRPIFGGGTGFRGGRNVERCPSCHQSIVVGEQPGSCPKCGTPLGRNREGKLLIRVN